MKIKKKIRDSSEPMDCESCIEEMNGLNYIHLQLFKGFIVDINLCDNCLNKLEINIKNEK